MSSLHLCRFLGVLQYLPQSKNMLGWVNWTLNSLRCESNSKQCCAGKGSNRPPQHGYKSGWDNTEHKWMSYNGVWDKKSLSAPLSFTFKGEHSEIEETIPVQHPEEAPLTLFWRVPVWAVFACLDSPTESPSVSAALSWRVMHVVHSCCLPNESLSRAAHSPWARQKKSSVWISVLLKCHSAGRV